MRRNAELSITMIIGIVIALVVLFLIIYFLSKNAGGLDDSTRCIAKGGRCSATSCDTGSEIPRDANDNKQLCTGVSEPFCCRIVG